MSYSIYEQTTIDAILTDVKEDLFLTNTTKYDFQLRRIITDGYKSIRSLYDVIQTIETVEICNSAAKLPCNLVEFNREGGIRFGPFNQSNPSISAWCHPVFTNQAFFKNDIHNNPQFFGFTTAQIVGDFLQFNSDIPFTKVHMSFLGLRFNADGTPFNPLVFKRPLGAYACYKFIRASKHLTGHTDTQMMDFKREWCLGKDEAEAYSKKPDMLLMQAIVRMYNAWV